MRKLLLTLAIGLGLVTLWYTTWRWILADDVARVKATIAYQNTHLKTFHRDMVLKADGVEAAGFPFHWRVVIKRPTLSMIDWRETYAVSFTHVTLVPVDAAQGRYRVEAPATFDALYAADGQTPEQYRVTVSEMPKLLLRAQGDSRECSDLPGAKPCAAAAAEAPLISYAVGLPPSLTLHMELNGGSRDAQFTLPPMAVPVFQEIPANLAHPLSIFVGMLREALVFKTK